MASKKKLPPELDPIFPIVAGYEIPEVEQGHGKQIMRSTDPITVTLPYRSFYFLWEYAERQGAKQYPKYVGGPMDDAAQTWLDAVYAMRSANYSGSVIRRFTEAKAKKAREILAKHKKDAKRATTAVKGQAEAPTEPSEAATEAKRSKGAQKRSASRTKPSRASKKPAGKKPRSKKRTR